MLGQESELPSFSRLSGPPCVCIIHLLVGAVLLPPSLAVVNLLEHGWTDSSWDPAFTSLGAYTPTESLLG